MKVARGCSTQQDCAPTLGPKQIRSVWHPVSGADFQTKRVFLSSGVASVLEKNKQQS